MQDTAGMFEDVIGRRRAGLGIATAALALVLALVMAPGAMAMTSVAPAPAHQFDWLMLRPTVTFDPAEKEEPKWVLLASDAGMTKSVRYCRQFVGVTGEDGGFHWGCGSWAIGIDAYGQDVLRLLEWGKTYYWQVVYTDATGKEAKGEVRSFSIKPEPPAEDLSALSDRIFDSAFGDGTELNLGASAFSNSAVRISKAASQRRSKNRFWIHTTYEGGIDLKRSYVRIRSKVGTRYVPVTSVATNVVRANWVRSASERRLRPGRYEYQAFLKSAKNGAFVKSPARVIVVQTKKRKVTAASQNPPAWTAF